MSQKLMRLTFAGRFWLTYAAGLIVIAWWLS